MDIPVLSASDASWVVSKRPSLPKKMYLSVKGCVTARSEVIRMKNEDSILLEIDHCIFILLKDFYFEWHSQLVPLEAVVFYQLRLTTIEKGVSKPQPILVVWESSKLLKAPQIEEVVCTPLSEWLCQMYLDELVQDSQISTYCNEYDNEILQSFHGKVSNIVDPDDAIYRLENCDRIVSLLSLSNHRSIYLQLGSTVDVYNAHKIQDKTGAVTFLCCTRSFVKSDVDPVIKQHLISAKESLKKTTSKCYLEDMKLSIYKYGLNFMEIQALLSLRNDLKDVRSRKEVRHILHYLAKSFCSDKEDYKVTPLDMFLEHEKFCPFVSSRSSNCRIPTQLKVRQLENLTLGNWDNWDGEESSAPKWHCGKREWREESMLLGSIVVNGDGETEFVDDSGKMAVVLIPVWNSDTSDVLSQNGTHSENDATSDNSRTEQGNNRFHQCKLVCQKPTKAGEKLPCPCFSPQIAGKLFYVNHFVLIEEFFSKSKEGCEFQELKYLMFSLQDCVVVEEIGNTDAVSDIYNQEACTRDTQKSHRCVLSNDHQSSCLVYISGKQQKMNSVQHGKCFYLSVRMLDISLYEFPSQTNPTEILPDGKEKEKEDTSRPSKNKSDCISNNEGKALKRHSERASECNVTKKRKCEFSNCIYIELQTTPSQNSFLQTRPVILLFKKENVRFFPFILSGQFYFLTTSKKKNPQAFEPVFSSEKLGKVVNNFNAKLSIEVPQLLEVKNAFGFGPTMESLIKSFDIEDKLSPISMDQLLSEDCEESLVSFIAVVIRRETNSSVYSVSKQRSKSNIDSFHWKDLRLDLCAIEKYINSQSDASVDSISLYFDRSPMLYMLSLLPGSVIEVSCVERKVSKFNTVYCRFIAVSSLYVKSYISSQGYCRIANSLSQNNFISLPVDYIGTIWNKRPGNFSGLKRIWHIQCHICVLFSIKLQLSCKKCRGTFKQNVCQSRGCKNETSFDLTATSDVLVEDGTCQAIVKLRTSNLVRKLLTLSERQWDDVTSLLQNIGEISISKHLNPFSSSSPLEVFLSRLTTSHLFIRPLKMLVRLFKDSPCKETVAKMPEDEFPLKPLYAGNSKLADRVFHLPLMRLDCVDVEERDWS